MRYCGMDDKSETCVCLSCLNDKCCANYGKLCTLCFYSVVESIEEYDYANTNCPSYYSWIEKIKGEYNGHPKIKNNYISAGE